MTTKVYKCKECKQYVDELNIWENFDGDYCLQCFFKELQSDQDIKDNNPRKL